MRALFVLALVSTTAAAEVKVEKLAPQAGVTKTVRSKPAKLGEEMQKAILGLVATTEGITGPPFARYVTRGETYVVEVGLPTKTGKPALPGGEAAMVEYKGPREKLADVHAELDAWLATNKRKETARWEVYVTNPVMTPDPAAQVTRVYVSLAK